MSIAKIKSFYVRVFSYVGRKLKQIIKWNKEFVKDIGLDWKSGKWIKAGIRSLGYIVIFISQILLALLILVSYVLCKISGICLIL